MHVIMTQYSARLQIPTIRNNLYLVAALYIEIIRDDGTIFAKTILHKTTSHLTQHKRRKRV
jgi:hypothetical protein